LSVALDEANDAEDVTARVSNRLGGAIPLDAVRARVRRNYSSFRDATVRQFVPVFVERPVRAEIRG
jgi:hypothetical protein